ncbi:hypothetical protein CDD82_1741 [Ophiocordyceps australis]|uniref:Heterokaryon incompatibility domain-containing protein n=1 Tax=Ophiocordyceps australis TaxID=1399860 RepID=A0A2C5ZKZ3_9HYPO|nr:hypothetical protein CDD82_1741 [Ophiocordyceps australis]
MEQHQIHPADGGLVQKTRTIRDTGLWAGRFLNRHVRSAWSGVCSVCNNLQPLGHEDTLGSTPSSAGRWVTFQGRQPLTGLVKEPALCIPNIKAKELLRARRIDSKTGQPFRSCRYCRLLCDALDLFFIDEYMNWETDSLNGMHLDVGLMMREGHPLVVSCSGCFIHDAKVMHPRVDLELFCATDTELATPDIPVMGLAAPRVMDTRSPSCMQFARDNLVQCLQQHGQCAPPLSSFVPKRLVAVNKANDSHVQLCEMLPPDTKWASLSHCWGGLKPLMLLTSNLESLKNSISVDGLPSTFQDAIRVCRSLDMPYLWIDSLCIIQDNKLDWQQQAAQMGTIYSQSLFVIVAASSAGPDKPFLGPREQGTREDFWGTKSLDFSTPSGANVTIQVRRRHLLAAPLDYGEYDPPFTETWATLKRVGPLYKRSWCFQESHLARRALHFAPGALIFECKTHRRSDDSLSTYSLIPPPGTSSHSLSPDTQWRMMVKSYTWRQLSFASDKLPALSGIASLAPQARTDQYLAGLWRKTLLVDLAWQVMACSGRTGMTMTYPPEEQSAPTWSWASINHGVLWNKFESFEPLATVVEASCRVDGENPYGAVTAGHIKISGRFLPCRVKQDYHQNQQHAYHQKPGGKRSKDQWFMGDGRLVGAQSSLAPSYVLARRFTATMEQTELNFDAGAFFLCLGRTGAMHYDHVGLMLTLSESQPGCMERIGNITNLPKSWYEEGTEATITLV